MPSQPGVGGELPCVRHLVQDQPAPKRLAGEQRTLLPLRDVGLDEVDTRLAGRLTAEKLGIVLAENAAREESEQHGNVAVDDRPSQLDSATVGDRLLHRENRFEAVAKDGDVEVDPA